VHGIVVQWGNKTSCICKEGYGDSPNQVRN